MQVDSIIQILEVSMDQLSSTCETFESPLDMLCLTQHYRANPEIMNTILIPVKSVSSPTLSLSRVTPRRRYEVLGNHHVFFARKKAQCPLARCLCLNRPEEQTEIWQTELQIRPGRPNIAAMNQEELQQAFAYLIKKEKVLAKLLSHGELIWALAEHPGRPYWLSWDPVKAFAKSRKVSITKTHTDCLDNYFCFDPQPLPSLCINTASAEELSRHFHILSLEKGFANQLSHRLSGSASRRYWHDFQDMTKALRAEAQFIITKTIQNVLAQGFYFTPAPPPIPNTVPFLLQQMTVKELRHKADERGLAHKSMKKKADLVRLLSSSQ